MTAPYEYLFDGQYVLNLDKDQQWQVKINPISRQPLGVREEARIIVKEWADTAESMSRPICLHFSGGDDSLAVLLSLKDVGVDFYCSTRIYKAHGMILNLEDVEFSTEYCKKHNIKQQYHLIDNIDYVWRNTPLPYMRDMSVMSLRMGQIENSHAFSVLGMAPMINSASGRWRLTPTFSSLAAAGDEFNYIVSRSLFLGSPEMCLSIFEHPAVLISASSINMLTCLINTTVADTAAPIKGLYTYERIVKGMILHEQYPELEENPRIKNTGFERRPAEFDNTPPPHTKKYLNILRSKEFTIDIQQVICAFKGSNSVIITKEIANEFTP